MVSEQVSEKELLIESGEHAQDCDSHIRVLKRRTVPTEGTRVLWLICGADDSAAH